MKKGKITSVVFIVGIVFYALSFMASGKKQPEIRDACNNAGQDWFYKDSNLYKYHDVRFLNYDTMLVRADTLRNVDWNVITDSLCKIYKANCGNETKKILVINYRDTIASHRDTKYGKKLFYKDCQ
jgi:hypothetical protein